jgi:hypothetical protein
LLLLSVFVEKRAVIGRQLLKADMGPAAAAYGTVRLLRTSGDIAPTASSTAREAYRNADAPVAGTAPQYGANLPKPTASKLPR